MPCFGDECDDDDWDGDDWDESDAYVPDDDRDDVETVPCPYCGKAVYEDAERCPSCQSYVSREDAPPARKPLWIIAGAAAVLVVVYMWIVP